MISDSGRYFEISLSVGPVQVDKDPSLIYWIRVSLFGQQRILWLKNLSLAVMLGDMRWGAVSPLVYCGCISVALEYLLVCCSGMDDEERTSIIHILDPNSLQ